MPVDAKKRINFTLLSLNVIYKALILRKRGSYLRIIKMSTKVVKWVMVGSRTS